MANTKSNHNEIRWSQVLHGREFCQQQITCANIRIIQVMRLTAFIPLLLTLVKARGEKFTGVKLSWEHKELSNCTPDLSSSVTESLHELHLRSIKQNMSNVFVLAEGVLPWRFQTKFRGSNASTLNGRLPECPMDHVKLSNLSHIKNAGGLNLPELPRGDYKWDVKMWDDSDDGIAHLTLRYTRSDSAFMARL